MSVSFRVNMSANDPEQAHKWLGETYMPYAARFSDNRGQFRAKHASADFDGFSLSLLDHYSIRAELTAAPTQDFVMILQPLEGVHEVTAGGVQIRARPGECFVVDPDEETRIRQRDLRLSVICVQRSALERAAAELTGEGMSVPVRFPLARPLSPERGQHWQQLMLDLVRDMPADGVLIPPAHTKSLRQVAAALLESFPNTALRVDPRSVAEPGERALRRAMAFIEANAGVDITVGQIAEAARVSPKELNLAFSVHLNTTPVGYLDRVRLEHAHRELRGLGDDKVTVAEVATRWGFAHPGRFSAEYQRRFGQHPLPGRGILR